MQNGWPGIKKGHSGFDITRTPLNKATMESIFRTIRKSSSARKAPKKLTLK